MVGFCCCVLLCSSMGGFAISRTVVLSVLGDMIDEFGRTSVLLCVANLTPDACVLVVLTYCVSLLLLMMMRKLVMGHEISMAYCLLCT